MAAYAKVCNATSNAWDSSRQSPQRSRWSWTIGIASAAFLQASTNSIKLFSCSKHWSHLDEKYGSPTHGLRPGARESSSAGAGVMMAVAQMAGWGTYAERRVEGEDGRGLGMGPRNQISDGTTEGAI